MSQLNEWFFNNSWAIVVVLVGGVFWGGYNWAKIDVMISEHIELTVKIDELKKEVFELKKEVAANAYQNKQDAKINELVLKMDKKLDMLVANNPGHMNERVLEKSLRADMAELRELIQ